MTDHFPDDTKKVDFILREDAVQCAEDIADDLYGEGAYEGARIVAERLKNIPAADVRPVVHGKWIDGKCDQCGEHAPYWCMASAYYTSRFCPKCGADMREG